MAQFETKLDLILKNGNYDRNRDKARYYYFFKSNLNDSVKEKLTNAHINLDVLCSVLFDSLQKANIENLDSISFEQKEILNNTIIEKLRNPNLV